MHQAGKAILFAMTKEMYRKGSKCIDELLQVVDVPLPDSLAKDIFLRNDWKLLSAQISASKPILVQVKVRFLMFWFIIATFNPRVHEGVCETLYGVSPCLAPTVFTRLTPDFLTFIFLG